MFIVNWINDWLITPGNIILIKHARGARCFKRVQINLEILFDYVIKWRSIFAQEIENEIKIYVYLRYPGLNIP